MNLSGHRSVRMVRLYIRYGNLFPENSAGKLGSWGSAYLFYALLGGFFTWPLSRAMVSLSRSTKLLTSNFRIALVL